MPEKTDRKLRRQILVGRYLLNPATRSLFRVGITPPYHTLIQTKGRKSGLIRRVPVAYGRKGNEVWLIAEHGRKAGWVQNFLADPNVRLLFRGEWVSGKAELVPDDDVHARARGFAGNPIARWILATGIQALETRPCSVHVTLAP